MRDTAVFGKRQWFIVDDEGGTIGENSGGAMFSSEDDANAAIRVVEEAIECERRRIVEMINEDRP